MVGTSPQESPPAQQQPQSQNSVTSGSSGFGGGRRPDSSFEQASLNTMEDERLFL